MRTFATGKRGRSLDMSKHKAILSTYYANVRSILEYCSEVWSGAAWTHMQRIRNIHRNKICSPFLLEKFPIYVPPRTLRTQSLFAVSFARVKTVRSCSFNPIPNVCNAFLEANRDVDVWESSVAEFRTRAKRYASERQR